MSAIDAYMKQATKHRLLTKDEELDLARKYRRGDQKAGQKLVEANLRYAVKAAHVYARKGFDLEDLVQVANEALVYALRGFNPKRGLRFLSYARWWVRAYLQRHCATSGSVVNFGGHVIAGRVDAAMWRLRNEGATDDEAIEFVAVELRTTPERVRSVWSRRYADVSMDEPLNDGEPATRLDLTESRLPSPEAEAIESEERKKAAAMVRSGAKSPREAFVVERRTLADDPATLAELGERLGLSRERVRQIEARVLDRVAEDLEDIA